MEESRRGEQKQGDTSSIKTPDIAINVTRRFDVGIQCGSRLKDDV